MSIQLIVVQQLPSPFGVGDSVISYIKRRFALMSRLSLVDEPADMATSA